MNLVLRFIPFGIVLTAMAYFSHIPSGPQFLDFENSDKLGHFGMFFLVGLTFTYGITAHRWGDNLSRTFWTTIAIGALLGLIDEYHQSFVPRRIASVGDWIADVVGVLTFSLIWVNYHFNRKIKNQ